MPANLRARPFERILLIKPSAVGDVIHTIPVLVKLRTRYPSAQIDWLLTPPLAELVGRHPALSNAILFERREYARFWKSWSAGAALCRLVNRLRGASYDMVIDLHGQFRSALLALAAGAPVRIGFDRPRREIRAKGRPLVQGAFQHGWSGAREGAWLAYTHRIPVPHLDVHAVDRYLWLGTLLGLDLGPPDFRLPIPAEAHARARRLLDQPRLTGKPLAVLVPGTIWETKHWHLEGYAEVARHLARTGRGVVLAGSPSELARCQALAQMCPAAVNLAGQTTLTDLAAVLRRAEVCITNDSGAMHLSVALGRPVVSVFGPTDPVWVGPYGRPKAVVEAHAPCSPCYLRKLRDCGHEHACMKQVTGTMVIDRLEQVLAAGLAVAG